MSAEISIEENEKCKKSFEREVHHLATLVHVNIIKMLNFDDTAFVILLEYAENGSLYDLLHSAFTFF